MKSLRGDEYEQAPERARHRNTEMKKQERQLRDKLQRRLHFLLIGEVGASDRQLSATLSEILSRSNPGSEPAKRRFKTRALEEVSEYCGSTIGVNKIAKAIVPILLKCHEANAAWLQDVMKIISEVSRYSEGGPRPQDLVEGFILAWIQAGTTLHEIYTELAIETSALLSYGADLGAFLRDLLLSDFHIGNITTAASGELGNVSAAFLKTCFDPASFYDAFMVSGTIRPDVMDRFQNGPEQNVARAVYAELSAKDLLNVPLWRRALLRVSA